MPKIEVYEKTLFQYAGKEFSEDELIQVLTCAKAELDDRDEEEGILKIELNDTNRPDLWSTAGLARALRLYTGGDIPVYDFFSNRSEKDGENRVLVDAGLQDIRPYISAFVITGKPLDEPMLKDLIQTQEKLCWNYGQKRKSIAMGLYRSDALSYPVHYRAADPEKTTFVPLGMEEKLNLREILEKHPKGIEFGWIVKDFPMFPYLMDDEGECLSFPPVINSAHIGAAQVGDENLFIELTGLDMPTLLLATSIVACDCADAGFTVQPVTIEYPYDTPMGKTVTTPLYFQEPVSMDVEYAGKLLGDEISVQEAADYVKRMGIKSEMNDREITIYPPEYRNDFLHQVDVVEDVMIGRGMETFKPVMPTDFTVGRYTPEEEFSREIKDIMVGLGFQEMVYNYLGSRRDFIEKMNISGEKIIRIANPMSENFEYVRGSILPCLCASESVSGNAVYPHNIFEVGKVALLNPEENYGSSTRNYLGFLTADKQAGFTLISSHVSALFFYLSAKYTLEEADDPRFIKGRGARIICGKDEIGIFGEIHPAVLENWGITMPCTAGEVDLDYLVRR